MENKENTNPQNGLKAKAEELSAYSDESYESEMNEPLPPRSLRPVESDQPQVPIMKGQYEIANGVCSWIGIWGMGVDNTILGLTSEFRYTFKGVIESESDPPISGNYTGYFFYKTNVPRRIYEKDLVMDFSPFEGKFQMVGRGTNEFGKYTLVGIFDPETKDLTCTKEYQSQQTKKKVKRVIPKPKPKVKPVVVKEEKVIQHCLTLLQHLMDHESAQPFLTPVDPVKLNIPDYFEIIKHPMDFGTIKKQLKNSEIKTKEEFVEKVRLVFDNAILYNKPLDEVSVMANTLSEFFEKELAGNGSAPTGTKPKPVKQVVTATRQGKQFVSKKREAFERINQLVRSDSCDLFCQNEFVNQYIANCQLQRKREKQQMEAIEKELCGIVIKPDPNVPFELKDLEVLKIQLQQLSEEQCRNLFAKIHLEEKDVTIQLSSLPVERIREIWMFLQQIKEESFVEHLKKEEVKRRKQVTEKMMHSDKKVIADLLSD